MRPSYVVAQLNIVLYMYSMSEDLVLPVCWFGPGRSLKGWLAALSNLRCISRGYSYCQDPDCMRSFLDEALLIEKSM